MTRDNMPSGEHKYNTDDYIIINDGQRRVHVEKVVERLEGLKWDLMKSDSYVDKASVVSRNVGLDEAIKIVRGDG